MFLMTRTEPENLPALFCQPGSARVRGCIWLLAHLWLQVSWVTEVAVVGWGGLESLLLTPSPWSWTPWPHGPERLPPAASRAAPCRRAGAHAHAHRPSQLWKVEPSSSAGPAFWGPLRPPVFSPSPDPHSLPCLPLLHFTAHVQPLQGLNPCCSVPHPLLELRLCPLNRTPLASWSLELAFRVQPGTWAPGTVWM